MLRILRHSPSRYAAGKPAIFNLLPKVFLVSACGASVLMQHTSTQEFVSSTAQCVLYQHSLTSITFFCRQKRQICCTKPVSWILLSCCSQARGRRAQGTEEEEQQPEQRLADAAGWQTPLCLFFRAAKGCTYLFFRAAQGCAYLFFCCWQHQPSFLVTSGHC